MGHYKRSKKWKQVGKNNSKIARLLHIAHPTVIKYLNKEEGKQAQISLYNSKIKGNQKQKDIKNYVKEHETLKEVKEVMELVSDFKTILLGKKKPKLKNGERKQKNTNFRDCQFH